MLVSKQEVAFVRLLFCREEVLRERPEVITPAVLPPISLVFKLDLVDFHDNDLVT